MNNNLHFMFVLTDFSHTSPMSEKAFEEKPQYYENLVSGNYYLFNF
jgi:hypothetical protein